MSLRRNKPGVDAFGLGVGDSVSSWAMSGLADCEGGVEGGQDGLPDIVSGLTGGGGDKGSGWELLEPASPPARNLRMPFMAVTRECLTSSDPVSGSQRVPNILPSYYMLSSQS